MCIFPKGADKSWVEKLYDKCKEWEHFEKPRLSQTSFIIKHFADNVEYQVSVEVEDISLPGFACRCR